MTLIVAVKSRDSVIIAADTQMSYGYSSFRTDSSKIERVDFANFPAIVAFSGDVANAGRCIAILREKAKKVSPTDPDKAGEVIQSAMSQLRKEIAVSYNATSVDEADQIIRNGDLDCSITVAFRLNREPQIINTSLLRTRYEKSRAQYETDGCGSELADFILKEYFVPHSNFETTAVIAAYAVWTVMRHDMYCGGHITVSAVCPFAGLSNGTPPESRVVEFSQERVNGLVKLIEETHSATKDARRKVVEDAFKEREAAYHRWLEREAALAPPLTDEEAREIEEKRAEEAKEPWPPEPSEDEEPPR